MKVTLPSVGEVLVCNEFCAFCAKREGVIRFYGKKRTKASTYSLKHRTCAYCQSEVKGAALD